MAAAILRVKRKKDEEPLEALLIACKRPKIESEETKDSSPVTTIVKFAGTVEKQEDSVVDHITKKFRKDILKENYKQHSVNTVNKIRENNKKLSNENRYKIVNKMRSLDVSLSERLEEDVINIIDVEDVKAELDKNNDNYVYDLYYTTAQEMLEVDNLVSVLPADEYLVFDDHYTDEKAIESDDSNSESNWRNDYPDSENSDDSIGENFIRSAIKNMNIEDDSSSDSDDFVYGLDEQDVERYGYKYAKYKAKIKNENEDSDSSININSDSNEENDDEEEFNRDDFDDD